MVRGAAEDRWVRTGNQPLGKATAVFGLDSEGLIQEVSNRVSGDTSASAAKRKAEEALRKAGRPVLVVMDDLDRLTPEELLVVFKLMRLVGHLPGVYYLISFDERTLLDVLQRSELVGNSEPRAREFLEKIVQVRLDLPAFRERDADLLVDRSLAAVLASHNLTLTPAEQRRLSDAYTSTCRPDCAPRAPSNGSSARPTPRSAGSPTTSTSSTSCSSPSYAPVSRAHSSCCGSTEPNSPAPASTCPRAATSGRNSASTAGARGCRTRASPNST